VAVPQQNILIIGAGIGGLSAAIALARAGQRVTVAERTKVLTELGAGLTVGGNALRALDQIGVAEEVKRLGEWPPGAVVRHYKTGEILRGTDPEEQKKRTGGTYTQIHRGDMQTILVDAARAYSNIALLLDKSVIGMSQSGGKVTAKFADGTTIEADALIGADGIKSTVRDSCFPTAPAKFTGNVAWRLLLPLALVPFTPDMSTVFAGPQRLVTRYLVRRSTMVNFVAVLREDAGWQAEGWTTPSTRQALAAAFEGWHDEVTKTIEAAPDGAVFKWGLFDREPLSNWINGRITLLGDAAHAMLPFLGQAGSMAMEDSAILGRCFEAAETIDEAFARYQAARLTRANAVLLQSRLQGDRFQSDDPTRVFKTKERIMPAPPGIDMYGYDPRTVPV
jgi:salicylate hydroxylase